MRNFKSPSHKSKASRPPVGQTRQNKQSTPSTFSKKPPRPFSDRPVELHVWGRHVVESFLTQLSSHNQESVKPDQYKLHVIVDKNKKAPAQLKNAVELAQFLGIKIVAHDSAEEGWPLAGNTELNHQRICLTVPHYPTKDIGQALDTVKEAKEQQQHGCVGLVLDQIQDPRNFGAILRSAAYFGIKFVIYGTDRQAPVSSLVLKTSAGGAFVLDLIPVTNLNRALEQLKDAGGWIVGTSLEEGKTIPLENVPKDRTFVAVMGNEEKGLRPEINKKCDYLVKISGLGGKGVDSLNVSVASGIVLHSLASLV